MRTLLSIALILCSLLSTLAATYTVEQVPNVQVADHTRHFSNPDGIASAAAQQAVDSLLADVRRRTTAEVVVVAIDDIDTDDPELFATQLFNNWGLGKSDKNNGILMLIVKDKRYSIIRTGYGAEGVLPDILAAQIRRNVMNPYFQKGDFDSGITEGVRALRDILVDPDAAAELHSSQADKRASAKGGTDFFAIYVGAGVCVLIALLVWLAMLLYRSRGLSDYQKYQVLSKPRMIFLCLGVLFIGIPIIAYGIQWLLLHRLRNHPRKCPRCGTAMSKLAEDVDNQYLTQSQDLEERLDSVDYDVWLCPKCGETEIYSFVNHSSAYKECPACHTRALRLVGTRTLRPATTHSAGQGEKIYSCAACGHSHSEPYTIPRKENVAPIIIPGGGGGGGFGGGGSFGGGFGGGRSFGGGSGGSW